MKRRRLIAVLIAMIFVGVAVALVWPRELEPRYQGKKLSEWLKISAWNLPVYDNIPALEAKEAEVAIRRIGTNALPYLIRSLTLETPGWKRELQAIGAQGRLFSQEWFSEADHKAGFALKGFEVLGPTASPAIPRLNRLLGDRYSPAVHQRVVMALVHIGKAGIPALVAMLGDRSRPDRRQAALALGRLASEFRTNAGPAVPNTG